ncbi:MAG TPA: hydrolase [Candidatus Angelobacter sp.]|nr:hydrolase [Candidatus Angelobacter sp.]
MKQLTAKQRADIVHAAREWLGTPYHHHGRVKKAGADCAMFPLSVYQECGVLPADYQPPEYSVQWHLHRSEELYLKEIDRFVNEIAGPPAPADFVVFRFGRTYSHGGIVIDWPIIIHAYIPHGVLLSDALRDGELLGRSHRFFELAVNKQQAPTFNRLTDLHPERTG